MHIYIDERRVEVLEGDENIIQVADRAEIPIPAPCYRDEKNTGCCKVCLVEIDGKRAYACATKPKNGMDVILHRKDLDEIRRDRIKRFFNQQKKNCP